MDFWRILVLVLLAFGPANLAEPPAISLDDSSAQAATAVQPATACPSTTLPAHGAQAQHSPRPLQLQPAVAQRLEALPSRSPHVPHGITSRPSVRPGMHIPPMDDDPPGDRSRLPV